MARLNLGLEGVIQLSRGYDGPEIDDFRDSGWDRERESPYRGSDRGRGHNWQTRANVRSKLQKAREVESRSDLPIAQSCERPESIRPTLSREDRQLAILKDCNRVEYTDRGRSYSLRPSEIHIVGKKQQGYSSYWHIVLIVRIRMEMLLFSPVRETRRLAQRTWHIVFFGHRVCDWAGDRLVGTSCVTPMQLG